MTKQDLAETVAAMGCTAKTFRGQIRYYKQHHQVVSCLLDGSWPSARWMTRAVYKAKRWQERMEARAERQCLALGLWPRSDAEQYAEELTKAVLKPLAADLERNWPFRQSESKWAGGDHSVSLRMGESSAARGESRRVWSDNGKWSGTDSEVSIAVTRRALDLFPTLRTRDGSVIVDAYLMGPRTYRAAWLKQGRGVDLNIEWGWIIRDYHVKAATLAQASRKAAAARTAALGATLEARDARRGKRTELAALRHMWLSVADSLKAGNCEAMTRQFASEIWRKIGASGECAVRADVVLGTRDDIYTRRALGAALADRTKGVNR